MFSAFSSLFNMHQQAKQYGTQARVLDMQADATRRAANANANAIEQTARANQEIAGENLMRARTNQRAALATVENQRAASGLTGTSTSQPRHVTEKAIEMELANLAQSASIASMNAWQGALDERRKGEIEAYRLEAQAQQYRHAAKATRRSMLINGISSVVGTAAGAYMGYQSAANSNANLQKLVESGSISQATADLFKQNAGLKSFMQGMNMGGNAFALTNSFNPWTAAIGSNVNTRKNNYGGAWSALMGNIPYQTTKADSLYQPFS
jgi:hypothetical protein